MCAKFKFCLILPIGTKSKKVSNILQSMKREKIVDVEGTGHAARRYLKK